ncbi:WAS/WASL-interacting protein family member 3 isoform X1 [Maylandia zebra]|uniref:WAS/WASL-interacting protein family member 3 isoform X1 n=2 Tax=Haplochromini TaxID=319058 RepID=A0A9Y3VCQ2_9CICH|nr:WAS/WASL-interacting protein family member 3 isoform X1 [Maylandia zebra]XP_004547921.1 WAS/WASL-interacting protein family member 3 isoform X1 [Maylandia zebra]XP_005728839.1 PREDICTED: WAS/WASL-interacting protein family member 3-like isoform X1 [Pundamilia nyererei]
MPVPPPPPPPPPAAPPPPPPPSAALPQCPLDPPKVQFSGGGGGGGRNALLADIQKGTKLKKVTQVNDRSAPVVNNSKASTGDLSGNAGTSQASSGGMAPVGPSLSGLFAGGFPTLRPTGQRDLAGKTRVSRSSSSVSLKPLWNPPSSADSSSFPEPDRKAEIQTSVHRLLAPSASAPPSPSHSSMHPPPFPPSTPLPPAPPSAPPPPPPPQAFQDRPGNKPPPLPSCPPPPPPSQTTKPMWLPIQHSQHSSVSQPSPPPAPPPPPPPPTVQPLSTIPGDHSSGYFYSPPSSAVYSETSRFPVLRDSPLGPPPPPPPPSLPPSITPSCPSTLPPPPPKVAPVPSPAMRSLPPSYPCNAPTRRPPAIPRSAGVGRLAPPPAPPARSPTTELSTRIPPPPPPPMPPSSLRNGHLQSLADDFESKFQFHPVEDLPPPDEFKPFPRIYPSKENSVNPKPPGIRTHLR